MTEPTPKRKALVERMRRAIKRLRRETMAIYAEMGTEMSVETWENILGPCLEGVIDAYIRAELAGECGLLEVPPAAEDEDEE